MISFLKFYIHSYRNIQANSKNHFSFSFFENRRNPKQIFPMNAWDRNMVKVLFVYILREREKKLLKSIHQNSYWRMRNKTYHYLAVSFFRLSSFRLYFLSLWSCREICCANTMINYHSFFVFDFHLINVKLKLFYFNLDFLFFILMTFKLVQNCN